MCGELLICQLAAPAAVGSSPRVRGTRARHWRSSRRTSVHPRVCGELIWHRRCAATRSGSSPRVRGTPSPSPRSSVLRRFIPACAGNSCRNARRWRSLRGSSPRVRGTPRAAGGRAAPSRFIPACAGNSPGRSPPSRRPTVHPRVCGELPRVPSPAPASPGSSPRVRGTPSGAPRACPSNRFIPACAGNSRRGVRRPRARPVHPRVCGELHCSPSRAPASPGSSPRVRGTHQHFGAETHGHRFIPACAGNSAPGASSWTCRTVHPRVCGELPSFAAKDGCRPRFIPACAGNSPDRRAAA